MIDVWKRDEFMKMDSFKKSDLEWNRGSLTVEASFIVPMAFMVIALMLVTCFYIHNRVYYSCAAYEAAIGGNETKGQQEGKAGKVADMRVGGQPMPGSSPSVSVSQNGGSTTVEFAGQTFPAFRSLIPVLSVSKTVRKVRPERTLRLLWAAGV